MPVVTPMVSRDPAQHHRASTPLELFFDLTFAVAVSQAAAGLEEGLVDRRIHAMLIGFPVVFFAIWWGWMNFTWFSSAFDNDDVPYRLAVFVQMTGILIVAAGIPRAMRSSDFSVIVVGYVVMRLGLVGLWLRSARTNRHLRATALRYAVGITAVQAGWVAWLWVPAGAQLTVFVVLAVLELAVPLWAERAGRTSWHPGHIAERYGLFTIILLGEILLATSHGIQDAVDRHATLGQLLPVVVGSLLTVFSMWWMYFDLPHDQMVSDVRAAFADHVTGAFVWGYGHYVVFAAAGATSAGLAIAVDQADGASHLPPWGAGLALTVPVALYLAAVWALHYRVIPQGPVRSVVVPVGIAGLVLTALAPQPALATGIVMAVLVALHLVTLHRAQRHPREVPAASGGGPGRPAGPYSTG